MNKINIAIDGYSGTGKSSTAKLVASQLGYTYVDTGAMYRASTYFFIQQKIDITSESAIAEHLEFDLTFVNQRIHLNGIDVEDQIRAGEVNQKVSKVSAVTALRQKLVSQQQKLGDGKGVVMDGRDIGTKVFPTAELKVFMTANVAVRAKRRQLELKQKGVEEDIVAIETNLRERDELDTNRSESPLVKAEGAIEIDTSHLTLSEQVEKIVSLANKIIYGN